MSNLFEASAVETADKLTSLEPEWWDLWRRSRAATPFQSPAWQLPWWHAFQPGRLCTVTVRRAGRLVALAPVYLEDGAHGRRLLPISIGVSDYLDLLIDPGEPEASAALTKAVHDLVPDWRMWELEELMPEAAGLRVPAPRGTKGDLTGQSASPVLDLVRENAIPPRKRRKLRMAENRVARRGGVVAGIGPEGVTAFLDHLVRLHGARWATRGENGVLADDPVRRFHALALPRLAEAGLARLWMLTIAGQVVGAYYGLQDATRAYAYLGGFDPGFSFESPGTVLIGHAIETARREGAAEFHFLRGQETYKYEWGATDRWNQRRTFRRDD